MVFKRIVLIFLICAVIVSLALIVKILFLTPGLPIGSLQINSLPKAEVFLNGTKVGLTPYLLEKASPGEYQIKLAATSLIWETKVQIFPGVLTFVSREMGSGVEDSAGQILTLEKIPNNQTCELAVISDPGDSFVSLDGLEKGKATALFKDLSCGDKVMVVSASGFADQVISAKLTLGLRLNAVVKLRKLDYLPPSEMALTIIPASPSTSVASQSAKVAETPTGFLRVRAASNSSALEIGRVNSGQTLQILSKDTDWVKIKFDNGEGWVSANYLKF